MSESQQNSELGSTSNSDESLDPLVRMSNEELSMYWEKSLKEGRELMDGDRTMVRKDSSSPQQMGKLSGVPLPLADLKCEGVEEKLAELIHRYREYCLAIARKIVRDYDAAEDVVQNAFLKAYLALSRYAPQRREELRIQSWLGRIVVNEARDYLVSRHELVRLDLEEGRRVHEIEGSEHDNPELVVMYEEEKASLEALLALLPPKCRSTLEFWLQYDQSYERVAGAEGCDVRTVRTRFHRATQRLAKIVKEKRITKSDLRRWLSVYQLVVEEWEIEERKFSLRDFIKGEAYANTFGGVPYRGQQELDEGYVPLEFLPPSYWD